MDLVASKVTTHSPHEVFPSKTSINALALLKKGRPRMSGTLSSTSISRITKSMGKTNLPTFTNRFSIIPRGYLTKRSAKEMLMHVGYGSPRSSCLYMTYGIRLMLAPRSVNAWCKGKLPRRRGIMKRPESPNFSGNLFCTTAEHCLLSETLEPPSSFLLLERRSLRNLPYFGIR
ncbi:hypothetical protein L1987_02019 [Smallanthus sonchifolius]|uniref:Uncharacterized protein n=1 Tax=Smallanthus sonchifolius TaxID=185202 RepID=A0ACB9K6W4_9ASTR|nr:hypothetical protein L1987_02019 [Smallanthus sonchifolius]